MSVDAGLFLTLGGCGGPISVLEALLALKWRGRGDGWWCVPLDKDTSEWELLSSHAVGSLKALFEEKMAAQQVFGLRLWWEGGDVGGEFLVFPNSEVVFSPSINRVMIAGRTTDVSWYLARVLPVFGQGANIAIESWIWRETG